MRLASGAGKLDAHLDGVAAGDQLLQLGGSVVHQNAAFVHDGDAAAELVGLVHIVRGEQDGEALRVERANAVPEKQARLRVQVVGRLIEEKHVG